jgi:hypothetical protein
MKKFYVIFALISLISLTITAQPQLTWRFNNAEVINAGTKLQFDVEVLASVGTSYHRDLQIYFDYNTTAFGSNIVAGGKITYSPLALMNTHYVVVNMADNTGSKFAIITEASNEMTQAGSATYFNVVPTTYTGLLRFTIDILPGGNTQNAGIAFDAALMNGGQYYQSTSNTDPLKYLDPSLYNNNLSTLKLSSYYGTTVYAKTVPVSLNACNVDFYTGAVLTDTYATGAAANTFYFTGMADGGFSIKANCSKVPGGIQAADALLVQRYILGALPLADLQKRAGDVNASNSITAADPLTIKRKVLVPALVWAAPNFVFDGPFGSGAALQGYPVTVSSGLGTTVLKMLCSGDVNASYTP